MKLYIQTIHNNDHWIKHPTYSKAKKNDDVGLDIPQPVEIVISKNSTSNKIPLGIKTKPTHGYMLVPRSSIIKTTLRLSNSIGIIDKSYRGELMAVVDNIGDQDVIIKEGSCMFQIVAFDGNLPEYELVQELDVTERGEGGFGSTTKK